MRSEVVDYIRQHRLIYSRQAIEEELTKYGFSPAEIEEAWYEANRLENIPNVEPKARDHEAGEEVNRREAETNSSYIVAYLRQNWTIYNQRALEKKLNRQGFSQEEIESAWEELLRSERETSGSYEERKRKANKWFWSTFFGFFLGCPIVIGLIVRYFKDFTAAGNAFVILAGIALVGGIIGTIALWGTRRGVAKGLLAGVLCSIVLGFIPISIVMGVCIVTKGPNWHP
ncbi:MAG: hypothetical protein WCS37_09420 [Chloroflexota bacterium]|nr:hypothetical protein [Chloroflexota bacterium]